MKTKPFSNYTVPYCERILHQKGYKFSHSITVIRGQVKVYYHLNTGARATLWDDPVDGVFVTDVNDQYVIVETLPDTNDQQSTGVVIK